MRQPSLLPSWNGHRPSGTVLPPTFVLVDPGMNVNWVHGHGSEAGQWMPPLVRLGLLMIGYPVLLYLPTHLLLRELFP